MNRDIQPLEGYPEPYGLLAAMLQDGTKEWRGELDADINEETVIWQPYAGMHSIGAIILHIAFIEVVWFERVVLGLPRDTEEAQLLMAPETDVDAWRWPTPPRQPLSWYFDLHDRIRARTLEGIKHWPAPDVPIGEDGDSETPRWILGHVIQHEAYHGGQAVLLSRLKQLQEGR